MTQGPTLRHEFPTVTGAASHVGMVRKVNEDSFLADDEAGLWCVSDGVGGFEAGDIASKTVVDVLAAIGRHRTAQSKLSEINDLLGIANRRVLDMSTERDGRMMGSTAAVLAISDSRFHAVWLGDSRIYLIRRNRIERVTRDHSEVQELMDSGVLTAEEARTWPRRNVITRAIGVQEDPDPEVKTGGVQPGDRFLICSDGLTNYVDDHELLAIAIGTVPQSACDQLIEMTLNRGASDNVTVIVVQVKERDRTVLHLPRFTSRGSGA
jgi:serine/threonine protein phosphatase PrpC